MIAMYFGTSELRGGMHVELELRSERRSSIWIGHATTIELREKTLQMKSGVEMLKLPKPGVRGKLPPLDLDGHATTICGLREKTLRMKSRGEELKLPK
jgi:hypothetical protein